MAPARHLVVVASAEPSTTDTIADLLRETCTVRTCYATTEVLERLDDEVDVVIVDPGVGADAVSDVREAVAERDLSCQIGLLTDDASTSDSPAGVDAVVDPSQTPERVRDTVEWLGLRATYGKTLDEYYALTMAAAGLETEETGQVTAELDRLSGQLEHLRQRLDETAAELDTVSLFEAALDGTRDE